jgi:hypothetical protein
VNIEADARRALSQIIPPIPTTTQETTVTRIAAAKEAADRASAALAGLAGNPLAEAIAESGAGATLDPAGVSLVLGIVSVIERNGSAARPAFTPAVPVMSDPNAPQQ